jgi:hypothetical protein
MHVIKHKGDDEKMVPDRSDTWSKSSYSANTDNCVEVKRSTGTVGVRDTKDRASGRQLAVSAASWRGVLGAVSNAKS